MIQELSKDQELVLGKYIRDTIDYVTNNEKYCPDALSPDDITEDINWMYKKAGQKPISSKKIIICESYKDEKDRLGNSNKDDATGKEIDLKFIAPVWDSVYSQIKDARSVYLKYINTFRQIDGLQSQIWEPIARLFSNQHESGLGLVYNINWLTLYSFASKIGWVVSEDFDRLYSFMKKGVWSIQFFKDRCYVTQMPKKIHRDNTRRLHSTESRAIEWRDGGKYKNFYIHGIAFEENMWEKIVTGSISTPEVLAIDNMEQRFACLSVIPPKKLISDLHAKLISTHVQKKRGKEYMNADAYSKIQQKPIELYKVEDTRQLNIREPIYILFYIDPSTGREYFSYVEEKNATDAAAAMASKFGMTRQQYIDSLVVEA